MYTASFSASGSPSTCSSTSTPAGGVTHEDIASQTMKLAANPGPSVPLALLAAIAFCYGKAMGDEHTHLPRYLLAALRVLPNALLALTTCLAPGNRTYERAITWGLGLCAVGDALIEMEPAASLPLGRGGHHLRLLSCGLALFVAAHVAYARAFVADMPPWSWEQATEAHVWGPALALAIYRLFEFTVIVPEKPSTFTGASPELLGVVGWTRLRMIVYSVTTSLLLALALARYFAPAAQPPTGSKRWAVAACALFVISDTLLSFSRQTKPFPFSEGVFLLLYFAGQTCMAMSVPAWEEGEEEGKEEAKQEEAKLKRATRSSVRSSTGGAAASTSLPGPALRPRRAVKIKKVD